MRAVPGTYTATLRIGDSQQAVDFEVRGDPRLGVSAADYAAQYEFVSGINRKLTETHQAITRIREAKAQLATIGKRVEGDARFAGLRDTAKALETRLGSIEETLYQVKMESPQDPLNFPIRLNDKLAGVMALAAVGDHPPTEAAIAVRDELVASIDAALASLGDVFDNDVSAFNKQAAEAGLEAVHVTTP